MPSLSYLRRTQPHVLNDTPPIDLNESHDMSLGIYDPELIQNLYPIDARSGFASSDLARILSNEIPAYEKEKILSRLTRVDGKFMPAELSDDDIMALVPPRFMLGDETNIQKWRDYLANDVLPYMADVATKVVDDNVPAESSPDNNNPQVNE